MMQGWGSLMSKMTGAALLAMLLIVAIPVTCARLIITAAYFATIFRLLYLDTMR